MSLDSDLFIDLAAHRGTFSLKATMALRSDRVTGIFGPSGSGKTTLLRALAGLDRSSGSIRLGATIWQDDNSWMPVEARNVGFVFQDARLFLGHSVRFNLDFAYRRRNRSQPVDYSAIVSALGLESLVDRPCEALSGGEAQRVAMARALLSGPDLILMDEPLAALDKASRDEIIPYLDAMRMSISVPMLYVSHAMEEIVRLADDLVVIDGGKIAAQGPLADVLTDINHPLGESTMACTILEGSVVDDDGQAPGLCPIDIDGIPFRIHGAKYSPAERVRLRVAADDVAVALSHPDRSSILNVFECTIVDLRHCSDGRVLIKLGLSNQHLIARVTEHSAEMLELCSGLRVWGMVKAMAVMDSPGHVDQVNRRQTHQKEIQ